MYDITLDCLPIVFFLSLSLYKSLEVFTRSKLQLSEYPVRLQLVRLRTITRRGKFQQWVEEEEL